MIKLKKDGIGFAAPGWEDEGDRKITEGSKNDIFFVPSPAEWSRGWKGMLGSE